MSIVRSGILSRTGQRRHDEAIKAIARQDGPAAASAICADIADAGAAIRAAISGGGIA